MPVEETLLDPPVTPAPIFAYRALRGWFVGSPDSSPERDNKENIPSVRLQPKSLDGDQVVNTPRLSPQKRKRDSDQLVSPTKSILRTPGGGPTPRAKSLREVNVKFKSVSPDVRRKEATTSGEKDQNAKDGGTTMQVVKATAKAPSVKTTQIAPIVEPQQISTNASQVAEPDLDEHFRRTEKEMKRLVKYGHKWRDVARQKDEENAKVRLLLEEAQRENKRLEALLRRSGRTVEGAKIIGKMAQTQRQAVSGQTAAIASATAMEVTTRVEKPAATTPALAAAAQDIEDLLDLTPPLEASNPTTAADQKPTSALMTRPLAPSNPLPTRSSRMSLPQRPASSSALIPTHSPLTALQHRIEGSVHPVADTAQRTNLPADRIAAVRKRLLAKEAARKAGLSVLDEVGLGGRQAFGVAGVGRGTELPSVLDGSSLAGGGKRGGKQGKGEAEDSVVDWVGV